MIRHFRFGWIALAAALPFCSPVARAQGINVTQFPQMQPSSPGGITSGPDGALWFTDEFAGDFASNNASIGRITTAGAITRFQLTPFAGPVAITTGPDGALWFTESGSSQIGQITTAGVVNSFPASNTNPFDITTGPDGALWFTDTGFDNNGGIGRMTTTGAFTDFQLPEGHAGPDSITSGPDGALWFTLDGHTTIGRVTTAGVFTFFSIPNAQFDEGNSNGTIVTGPDGNLWFTLGTTAQIGNITTAGVLTLYPVTTESFLNMITVGSDGALWAIGYASDVMFRITTAGAISQFTLPNPGGGPSALTSGPDGALWFVTETNGEGSQANIGRAAIIPQLTVTAVCPANAAVLNAPYSFSITTTGGFAPLTWTLNLQVGGLPPGLTLNSATGVISGTPTETGAFPFLVTITDSSSPTQQVVSFSCTITVAPQLTFTSGCPAVTGFRAVGYSATLSATGGTPSYTWSILPSSAALPPGLALVNQESSTQELLQGTPATAGVFPFTIRVQDSGGQTATQSCSIAILAPLTITAPATLPGGMRNATYPTTSIQAQGGTTPYTWAATGLPPGLAISSAGVITGIPTTGGTYTPTVTVTDSSLMSLNITTTASSAQPYNITAGPDGALWFTEYPMGSGVAKIGRITTAGALTEYPVLTSGSQPNGITAGPDGALWFTETLGNNIGRITTAGVVTEFPVLTSASQPFGITTGPDGALWFTESGGGKIGRITTAGIVTEFQIPTSGSQSTGITAGSDGALWFTEEFGNKIGRVTTAGVFSEFNVPTGDASPLSITAGPDSALWFTEEFGNRIGRITTAGIITEYQVPTAESEPNGITTGPDGALWFTETIGNNLGRITTAGSLTEYPIPTPSAEPFGIASGPDGALWFAENGLSQIGRAGIVAERAQKTYSITIVAPAITITGACPLPQGTQNVFYSVNPIQISGGNGVYQLTLSGPSWLSLAASSGTATGGIFTTAISGFASVAGAYPVSLQVQDTAGSIPATSTCTLTINPPVLVINSGCPLTTATIGTPFSQPLNAGGGIGNYVWSILSGSLPNGIGLNGNSISGTPTGPPGVSNFTLQLTSGNQTAQQNCALTVLPPQLKITSACPGNGTVGVAYGPFALTASGGGGQSSYVFSSQGNLPAGVGISGSSLSGTPTAAGTYGFTIQVTSSGQTAGGSPCSVVISPPLLHITGSCSGASVNVGSTFTVSVTVTGGQSPYSFALSGASWLALSPASGANDTASGAPTAANGGNTFTVVVTASDSAGSTPAAFSCTVAVNSLPRLTFSLSCPANPVAPGTPINIPVSASGGAAPYGWAISGNSGLSMSSASGPTSSVVGNAPGAAGSYTLSVMLSDSVGSPSTPQGCTLTIGYSQLTIQGVCPASSLTVPVTLSVPLTATGGQSPYSWSLSAPSWLGISPATGPSTTLSSIGTPSTSGAFSFTVSLSDSTGSTPAQFSCSSTIAPPTIPSVSITGLAPTGNTLLSTSVGVQLASPAPLPLTGTLQLSFIPNAFGITNNPQVVFNGGGTQATFTIPAGQSSPLGALPAIQQGTVAGTIQVQLVDLKQGSNEVLPTPAPLSTLIIPQQAPVITSVCFANQSATGFDVLISGYSNPRSMTNVILTFQAASGAKLNGSSSATENIGSVFTQFYGTAQSQLAGSMFTGFDVPISVSGDETAIGSVTVTLTNSVGSSSPTTQSLGQQSACGSGS